VDRGEASRQHSHSGAQKILLAEHNMPLRTVAKDNSRQRQAVGLTYIQGFLPPDGGRSSLWLSLPPSVKQSCGKSKRTNIIINKKILEDQPKGKWAEELPRDVWSHNTSVSRATNFTPFRQLYGEEPVRPEDIKFRSTRTRPEAVYSPTKAKPKDLIELERIKADENQHAYQSEMRVWKDKKVKE
jgi:hypothetical protein